MPGRVLITRPIPEPAPNLIARAADRLVVAEADRPLTVEELRERVRGFDAVLCMLHDPIDATVLRAAEDCRVFANMAVGFNNIDVAEATRLGILVTNTPGVLTEATADLTWALILAVPRRVAEGDRVMRAGRFPGWGPNYMLGGDVTGRTLGLVGPGRIALAVAERAVGFKMPILYAGRRDSPGLDALGARRVELVELLQSADFVSLHVPLSVETTHLIDARALALMKPTAYLINTSRGPVVDESALVDALKAGRIAGAGLDVYEREPSMVQGLADRENAVLLPHLGSATFQTRANMSRIAAENVIAVLEGRRPPNLVNPDAWRGASAPPTPPPVESRADRRSRPLPFRVTGRSLMGLLKFRIPSPVVDAGLADLRKSYVTGLDRTPSRLSVEIRRDMLICQRGTTESGRLFAPWSVEGFGSPFIGTATLGERPEPYHLAVELARGKLNDVRNQLADWKQMGLKVPDSLDRLIAEALLAFFKSTTGRDDPAASHASAQRSLCLASEASQSLVETYVAQVLQNRLAASKLPTQLAIGLEGDPSAAPWAPKVAQSFNAAQLQCSWKVLSPTEGKHRWEDMDAQLAWATRQKLAIQAGPLVDLRPGALPDWIWLWSGDFDAILGMAVDIVRQAVTRYRGKVPLWHLIHRPGSTDVLGMSEEDQIRLTARLLQVARQADPSAHFLVGLDRPWAEWMALSTFQLGPLHLADYLARAELGMAGIALEIAPGYSSPGSHLRDLLDFSKLLDLFALLNYPLYLTIVMPSAAGPDPLADPHVQVEADQWPSPPTETNQAALAARWIALAVAKPFVRSVTWRQLDDSAPHLYPHGGLIRPKGTPKPLLDWLKNFRSELLQ